MNRTKVKATEIPIRVYTMYAYKNTFKIKSLTIRRTVSRLTKTLIAL